MLVSIARFEETGPDMEEGIRHVLEEVVPSIEGAQGLRAAYWAVDRDGGTRISVLVWENADAASAVMPGVAEAIKQRRAAAGRTQAQASPAASERFEVVAAVHGPETI